MKYSLPIKNSKYTLISKKPLDIEVPSNIDRYEGSIETIVHDINKFQFKSDQLYNAHIIITADTINSFTLSSIIKRLPKFKFDHKQVYVNDIKHHGEYLKNIINSDFFICDSYMLPIIGYQNRADATIYGNILNHRARLVRIIDFDQTFLKPVL